MDYCEFALLNTIDLVVIKRSEGILKRVLNIIVFPRGQRYFVLIVSLICQLNYKLSQSNWICKQIEITHIGEVELLANFCMIIDYLWWKIW